MKKYEAMFILRPDLPEDEKNALFSQIKEEVTKNNGSVTQAAVWEERRKLYFPIKKFQEGVYYLMNFDIAPSEIVKIRHAYKLNEGILRVLVSAIN
ncbi:MAG: 30S ribosomal protein S6 [Candidatus Omnitrophica bacterium]|nr:30S ribosomal protein S6 [Candidatus Omnitrophota bacterium]